jgi:hypothetical protein
MVHDRAGNGAAQAGFHGATVTSDAGLLPRQGSPRGELVSDEDAVLAVPSTDNPEKREVATLRVMDADGPTAHAKDDSAALRMGTRDCDSW